MEQLTALTATSTESFALSMRQTAAALIGHEAQYVDEKGITQKGIVTSVSYAGAVPPRHHRRRIHPSRRRLRRLPRSSFAVLTSPFQKGHHHAPLSVRRNLGSAFAPDHARRHRQQHRHVNTTGFKASAVQFQDSLSQLVRNSMMPQQAVGGQNPAQVGLGVQVAGISTNFASGRRSPPVCRPTS